MNRAAFWKSTAAVVFAGGATLLMPACGKSAAATAAPALTLSIISPHSSDIRREFGDAFSRWHQAHFGTPVDVEWPDVGGGGTSNIVRELDASYKLRGASDYDIAFGGGSQVFNDYLTHGFLVKPPPPAADDPWKSDPIDAIPAAIFGGPLHGTDGCWVAATMSAFGMTINKDRIAELRLHTPVTWNDLAQPEWFGRLSLADPSKSGSVKTSYEMLLQQYGWQKGWGILTEMFASTGILRDSGSAPADDVGNADAVAGVVIDFYGRLQILRVGPSIAGFVIPAGGTVLDADPIALLKGAPHEALAGQFIRFVVSEEGQRLWILRAGTPGGPRKTALGRAALLEDLYRPSNPDYPSLSDPTDPFIAAASKALVFHADKQRAREPFLGDLIKSALIDNRDALIKARRAIARAGNPPALLARLEGLPTYRPVAIDHGSPAYGPDSPLDDDALAHVHDLYSPPKGDPRTPFSESLQNDLRDRWREQFAVRFATLEREAQNRK